MAAELCSACQALAQLALLSGESALIFDVHTKKMRCFWAIPLLQKATSSCLKVQVMVCVEFMLLNGMLGLYCRVYMQCEVAEL